MGKETSKKFLSKVFLGEFSKTSISIIFGVLNIPLLLSVGLENLITILKELTHKSIVQWQLSVWLLSASLFLSFSFSLILFTIYFHKHLARKQSFYLFNHNGYQWKLLLPSKRFVNDIPNCQAHGVPLSESGGYETYYKCPFCSTSITATAYELGKIADEARGIGIAKYYGHYKNPNKWIIRNLFFKK